MQTLIVEVRALCLVGIRCDRRKTGDEQDGLTQYVFQRSVIRFVVVGIQSEDISRNLIHDAA